MAPPVDFAADWKRFNRSLLRDLSYREYDPAADAHAAAPGEACVGVRGAKVKTVEGGNKVTRTTWEITGLADTPLVRSQIVDDADTWVIEGEVEPDPTDSVFRCKAYLA